MGMRRVKNYWNLRGKGPGELGLASYSCDIFLARVEIYWNEFLFGDEYIMALLKCRGNSHGMWICFGWETRFGVVTISWCMCVMYHVCLYWVWMICIDFIFSIFAYGWWALEDVCATGRWWWWYYGVAR